MVEEYQLKEGKVIVHRPDMAEVIVNEGVEIDAEILKKGHDFLREHLTPPFSLLINKEHSYSYDMKAQLAVGELEGLDSVAVVYYSQLSKTLVDLLLMYPWATKINIKTFADRERAMAWLAEQQDRKELDRE